jgi:isoaspartyl peptidase/L-asparaginase-like protein (Ntn-hydrolase superfamily)
MSKKSKKAAKAKRLQKKRARRAANKARYEEMRLAGKNSKSKRFLKKSKTAKLANTISHPEGKCGNVGCVACDPLKIHTK